MAINQPMKKQSLDKPPHPPVRAEDSVLKKPYASPALVEYGTIAKLTQGSLTNMNDGVNSRRMSCL